MRERGSTLEAALRALSMMAEAPITPGELAACLECSRDTVERIIAGARRAGFAIESRRDGRRVLYRLTQRPQWLAAVQNYRAPDYYDENTVCAKPGHFDERGDYPLPPGTKS